MSDLDEAFRNPEGSRLSDKQFEMLMAERRREKDQARGMVVFLVLFGGVAAIITTAILAANGVFGG